jgi:hypothetical protein
MQQVPLAGINAAQKLAPGRKVHRLGVVVDSTIIDVNSNPPEPVCSTQVRETVRTIEGDTGVIVASLSSFAWSNNKLHSGS